MRAVPLAVIACGAALFALSCTTKVNKVVQSSGPSEGLPEGPRPSEPCTAGNATYGIDAFDMTPDGAGAVCDVPNVLDDDGNVTGLASAGDGKATLKGHDVNGCVGVQFGDKIVLASLKMKMRPSTAICGHQCTEGGNDGCGTGWKLDIYVGPTFDELQWLQQLPLTQKDFFEYGVTVHSSYKANVAVICREATAGTGDDVAIDAIWGVCDQPPK